jgi:hypothetical protein
MKRITSAAVAVLALAQLGGCSTSYLQTGDPEWCPSDVVTVNREAFDYVKPGMSRDEIKTMLGTPTDVSKTVMYWHASDWGDAWVFFDATGKQVTGKYWADQETLRLEEVPPYQE